MPPRPTDQSIALVMIVKDESHVIRETLENLCSYIHFTSWFISDTGSSDTTKEIIRDFFADRGIPGELFDDPWKDFGFNRTKAFEHAYKKTDYAFVWDADDRISGSFELPKSLSADEYRFSFDSGFHAYSRAQLFNNKKRWSYVGVLHEYPKCLEPCGQNVLVEGNYRFHSNRTGARNKDPKKYEKDGIVLEEGYKKAVTDGDNIRHRYAFYCAQSYRDAGMKEKSLEFYTIVTKLEGSWSQERYVACIEAANLLEALGRPEEGLPFCVESIGYDSERVEGVYRLVKWYCLQKQYMVAYKYYTWISKWFETRVPGANLASKLFAKVAEYEIFLPYYMLIVCDKVAGAVPEARDVGAKMIEKIVKTKMPIDSWWLQNFFHNCQFFTEAVSRVGGVKGCRELVEFWISYAQSGKVSSNGSPLKGYVAVCAATAASQKPSRIPSKQGSAPSIVFTVTTCKRLDLFRKTMRSILNTWTDWNLISQWICIDDNSSEEDRAAMQEEFPWFEFIWKTPEQKGHSVSMQMLWKRVMESGAKLWIHMEDDWAFFRESNYVERGVRALHRYSRDIHAIGQFVFNQNYGVVWDDTDRVGGKVLEEGLLVHEQRNDLVGKNCGYWPHFSLQPSMMLVDALRSVGDFQPAAHFEKAYGERWTAAGWRTGFFSGLWSIHIGKQHWEKEGANAYALNGLSQFGGAVMGMPIRRDGWEFRAGEDQIGEDLDRAPGSLESVLEESEKDPRIVAVNSLGYRKLAIREPLSRPGCFLNGGGIYVRSAPSAKPAAEAKPMVEEVLEGDMRDHFKSVTGWIADRKPFALIRPNDGEYLVLANQSLTNADRWTFKSGGALRDALEEACRVAAETKGIYVGIPCGSCKGDYSCKPEMYSLFDTVMRIPRERQTYANLFMNCNWRPWLEVLKEESFYLVAPGDLGSRDSRVKGHLVISETLVDRWDSEAEVESEKFLEFVRPLRGELVLVCAGPIAKIWIAKAWKENPTCCYVDCGATLDYDTKGTLRRQYASEGHPSQKFCCSFVRAEDQQLKKYLVYFGTFLNEQYLELLMLALQSLAVFSDLSEIQVCVLTSEDLVEKVRKIGNDAKICLQIEIRPFTTIFEAACARFDWESIVGVNSYEKILYLDTDVLVTGDLGSVLKEVEPGTGIAAVEEGTIDLVNLGGDLFRRDGKPFDGSVSGLNSGVLLFRPCAEVREVFAMARKAVQDWVGAPPSCMDQPFLSWAAIRSGCFTRNVLEGVAGLFEKGTPSNAGSLSICHFSFPIGNASHKLARMRDFLNWKMTQERVGEIRPWENTVWGWREPQNRVTFHRSGKVSTPWGEGTWKPVGQDEILATWRGYSHFCKRRGAALKTLRLNDFDRTDAMLVERFETTEPEIPVMFKGGTVQWQKLIV